MRETTLINVMPSRANVLYRTIYGFTNAEAFNSTDRPDKGIWISVSITN